MSKLVGAAGFDAGRSASTTGGLAGLRLGAALALVFAAGGLAPALAQSAPQPADTPAADNPSAAPDEDQQSRTADGTRRLRPGEKADKVVVTGETDNTQN